MTWYLPGIWTWYVFNDSHAYYHYTNKKIQLDDLVSAWDIDMVRL